MIAKRNEQKPFAPDYAVPPGETLLETIQHLGIDQRELSERTRISTKHISEIINGKAPISCETAILLEMVTGVPARFWNNLESNYREKIARIAQRDRLREDLIWLSTIPHQELMRRGAIRQTSDKLELLEQVLSFFGVVSVTAWETGWSSPKFAFRKSLIFKGKPGAMASWLRLGEIESNKIECGPFDEEKFRHAVAQIRSLTTAQPKDFIPLMTKLCGDAGVALVFVKEIKNAPVSGAAKWISKDKAMICLNLRGKRNDRFWFTFFHEAGHILGDSKKETFIDVDYAEDIHEKKANQFAADILIPERSAKRLRHLSTERQVMRFASELGIAPGIVVGRMQREGLIQYWKFDSLKTKIDWDDLQSSP